MELKEYFDEKDGVGVLATADENGIVDVAIYSRPHVIEENIIAFIMADRLTHKNLEKNPHAAYLFKEDGDKYTGRRLYLTKIKEEKDSPLIETLRRKKRYNTSKEGADTKYLVYFRIDKVLPLIGE
ncbi:MAG: pyridoxamine 5'-phosphate oxidase family protein [Syntrophorhabdaceae bacterium]|nr:pyridoxamine 5'-phosphate oxidase family protein [Syntrophorhabdaceae bacterium]